MSKDITQPDKPQEGFSQNPLQQIMKNTKYSPKNQNVNHIRKNDATPPFYINHFFGLLVGLGLLGGLLALIVPTLITWPITDTSSTPGKVDEIRQKSISDLRLHILYITGGIIAVLTLLQTNWKNQIDRRKVEDDIEKNKNDHRRQVHAERRTRYAKAIEQLADEKVVIRLGGIYTLAGLVDEWIADTSLETDKEREKEGQIIINNLCAYIRSPYPYTSIRNYLSPNNAQHSQKANRTKKHAELLEEQEVRQTIFTEISKRLGKKDYSCSTVSGTWNVFNFDFSKAPIFYPLNGLNFENSNFAGAKFYDESSFKLATFWGTSDFHLADFAGSANFNSSIFEGEAIFNSASFSKTANFGSTKFNGPTDFKSASFKELANFNSAHFKDLANFNEIRCNKEIRFRQAHFKGFTKFKVAQFNEANFSAATFLKESDFTSAKFAKKANFLGVKFTENACFKSSKFEGLAYFNSSFFNKGADFSNVIYTHSSPTFIDTNKKTMTKFSCNIDPQKYKFTSPKTSPFKVNRGLVEINGIKYRIPVGTVLFDPDSGPISEPAKPIEESDN